MIARSHPENLATAAPVNRSAVGICLSTVQSPAAIRIQQLQVISESALLICRGGVKRTCELTK